MHLLFEIDTKDYPENGTVSRRPSVRGIIIRAGKICMVHSLKYDYYKFPGGGIEPGETHEQALIREAREETGLILRPESIAEMCRPQGKDRSYGLALTTYTEIISGTKLVGMRGHSHGVHSIMVYDPEKMFGFVVINNGYNPTVEKGIDMNYRIIRALYKDIVQKQ